MYNRIGRKLRHIALYTEEKLLLDYIQRGPVILNNLLKMKSSRTLIFQKNCFTCFIKSTLKLTRNAFYFTLKAFLVIKVFRVLS